ncbi:MAG TPA: serine protease [Cytophagales bacterium]|nr:serine protease [Cytophagales bacterium]
MTKILKSCLAAVALILVSTVSATAQTVLVIAEEHSMTERMLQILPPEFAPMSTKIRVDTEGKAVVTDEGSEIAFDQLFTAKADSALSSVAVLRTEYAPDFLLLGWVLDEKTEEYASYGLKRLELGLRMRLIDMHSGKEIYTKKVTKGTEFSADASDSVTLRDATIESALFSFKGQALSAAYQSHIAANQGVQNRFRIAIQQIDQESYFGLRDLILGATHRAGIIGEPRISYSHDAKEATLRIVTSQTIDDYYRALYASFSGVDEIDGFELSRQGTAIDLVLLPSAPRVISIKTLSPKDYASLGRFLVSTVSGAPGVSEVEQSYSEKDQTLVVKFLLKGRSLYSVDGVIWAAVSDDPRFQKLAMGELDKREIEYFFSGKEGAASADVIIALANVSSDDYKQVATAFSDLVGKIKGVRNLRYRYDFEKQTVVYRLQYEGEGLHVLDDGVARAMLSEELFSHVSKGAERLGQLTYTYSRSAQEAEELMAEQSKYVGQGASSSKLDLDALDHSVVYLYSESEDDASEGTGFFVSNSGYILTNAHVIKGSDTFIRTFDGNEYRTRIIQIDEKLDLALLRVVTNVDTFASVTIGDSEAVNRGQPVMVIGNPLGQRFESSVLTGIVSGRNRTNGLLQLSVPTYPGISGSPVFDQKNNVIAVMVAAPRALKESLIKVGQEMESVNTVTAVEGIGLAIPINHARTLLQIIN